MTRPARYALLAITIPMLAIVVWLVLLLVIVLTPGDGEEKALGVFLVGAWLFALAAAAYFVLLCAALVDVLFPSKRKSDGS